MDDVVENTQLNDKPRKKSLCVSIRRNATNPGVLISLFAGMDMLWGFQLVFLHLILSWFIGGVIGAVTAAIVNTITSYKLHTKWMALFCSILIVAASSLIIVHPYNYHIILAARYLSGIANGLIFAPTIILAGEKASKEERYFVSSSPTLSFNFGVFLQILHTIIQVKITGTTASPHLFGLVFGSGSVILSLILIESPIFYLMRGEMRQAMDTMQSYNELTELENYIDINSRLTFKQSAIIGLPALLKLCFYRGLMAVSFSALMFSAFIIAVLNSSGPGEFWQFVLFGLVRCIPSVFISGFIVPMGLKKSTLLSFVVCGALAIGIAVTYGSSEMTSARNLMQAFQFFAAIAFIASPTYLSEAFPRAVKSVYIAIVFIVEMLVHIIIVLCMTQEYSTSQYFYALGVLSFAFVLIGFKCLPETRQTTLFEAQAEFRGWLSR